MVKTYNVVLKDFGSSDFCKLRYLVSSYPHRLDEPHKTQYGYLVRSLLKTNPSTLPIRFKVTKDEFRLISVIIDIMSIGAHNHKFQNETLSYSEVHGFFTRLERKFIRMFHESVYADADNGESTSRKRSEQSIGIVQAGSTPAIGVLSSDKAKLPGEEKI